MGVSPVLLGAPPQPRIPRLGLSWITTRGLQLPEGLAGAGGARRVSRAFDAADYALSIQPARIHDRRRVLLQQRRLAAAAGQRLDRKVLCWIAAPLLHDVAPGDNSNTQFGLIGLWVALPLGVVYGSEPLLPNLVADPPNNVLLETSTTEGGVTKEGEAKLLLRFNGYVHNVGPGAVDFRGRREAPKVSRATIEEVERAKEKEESLPQKTEEELAVPPMQVFQRLFTTPVGVEEKNIERAHVDEPSGGEMLYVSADGHHHWHLQRGRSHGVLVVEVLPTIAAAKDRLAQEKAKMLVKVPRASVRSEAMGDGGFRITFTNSYSGYEFTGLVWTDRNALVVWWIEAIGWNESKLLNGTTIIGVIVGSAVCEL